MISEAPYAWALQTGVAAVAAAVSWQIAVWLFGLHTPYFAPLAAVLASQVTVGESLSRGGQRIIGVVGGIVLAMAAAHVVGVSAWSVGALVLLGMGLGQMLGFGSVAVSQVAVSSLLIVSLGAKPAYAGLRLVETVLGVTVAVGLRLVVVPPNGMARISVGLADALRREGRLICRAANALGRGESPDGLTAEARMLHRAVERLGPAVARERAILAYSPLLRRRRRRIRDLEEACRDAERVSVEMRGLLRSLGRIWTTAGRDARLWVPTLVALAWALRRHGALLDTPGANPAGAALGRALVRRAAATLVGRIPPRIGEPALREAASALADVDRMADDLGGVAQHALRFRGSADAAPPAGIRDVVSKTISGVGVGRKEEATGDAGAVYRRNRRH